MNAQWESTAIDYRYIAVECNRILNKKTRQTQLWILEEHPYLAHTGQQWDDPWTWWRHQMEPCWWFEALWHSLGRLYNEKCDREISTVHYIFVYVSNHNWNGSHYLRKRFVTQMIPSRCRNEMLIFIKMLQNNMYFCSLNVLVILSFMMFEPFLVKREICWLCHITDENDRVEIWAWWTTPLPPMISHWCYSWC